MSSMRESVIDAPATLSLTRLLPVALACFFPAATWAQDAVELGALVFDRVSLSAARESPLRLGRGPDVDRRGLRGAVREHLAAIEPLRQSGSSNHELAERLGMLAVAYQGLDRHEEALAALNEAVALMIEEYGRNGAEQIPLLEQKIPSYLALGDIRSIDETEETVYALKERSYGAGGRQMYYATINLADWNMTAYYRENFGAGNRILRRQRGVVQRAQRCIAAPGRVNEDGSRACNENPIFTGAIKDVFEQDINDPRLRKIDRLYANFQEDLIDSGNVQLDIIIDLSKRVARLAFATKQEMDFERDHFAYDQNYQGSREQALRNSPARMDESYLTGEKALRYAIDFPTSVAGLRPEALAALLLDLGDWHLAYGRAAAAEEAYGDAYDVLRDAGFTSENIDRALASDVPVQIPIFATHLYTRRSTGLPEEAELGYEGYLDVAYTVDSLGNASDVEILGRSSDDSSEISRLLEVQLQSAKFRPVLQGGRLVSPGRIETRYYYSY